MSKRAEIAKQVIPLDPHPKVVAALGQLEEALGGREQIANSLQVVQQPLTVEEEILTNLLADPANQSKSLAELCGQTGITIGRVLDMFGKAEGAQAYAKSLAKIYKKLPDVVGDVMERALPKKLVCKPCKGLGLIPVKKKVDNEKEAEVVEEACLACGTSGWVEEVPELERQKIALQLGGFLKEKPGVQINSTTNNQTNNMQLTLVKSSVDFRSATDRLLFPGRDKEPVVEAEVVPPAAPAEGSDVQQ